MNKITMFAFLLLAAAGFCQIPAGYYNSANGFTGYRMKTKLKKIVTNGHDPQSYKKGLWSLYANSIRDYYYENDGTILDIYSENPAGADPYSFTPVTNQCGSYNAEGDCYNKEHLIPQAYFSSAMPMYSDAHHIVPTDGKVNGWRGNLPFGVVSGTATNGCNAGATNTPCHTANNSKLGSNLNSGYSAGFSGKVFEPIDEFKGDVARSFLYFATRYEDDMPGFYSAAASSLEVKAMFDGSSNKVFNSTFLNILLVWNAQDPVSAKEIAFNNAIYNFQSNRNPYIDHPEYVTAVWGAPLSVSPTTVLQSVSLYPNPASNNTVNIYSETTLDKIEIINLNGQMVRTVDTNSEVDNVYTISDLPQGFYLVRLASGNESVVKKLIVN